MTGEARLHVRRGKPQRRTAPFVVLVLAAVHLRDGDLLALAHEPRDDVLAAQTRVRAVVLLVHVALLEVRAELTQVARRRVGQAMDCAPRLRPAGWYWTEDAADIAVQGGECMPVAVGSTGVAQPCRAGCLCSRLGRRRGRGRG